MIESRAIREADVNLALSLPDDLLGPGRDRDAAELIRVEMGPPDEMHAKDSILYELDDTQKAFFKVDLSAQTPERYLPRSEATLTRLSLLEMIIASRFGDVRGLPDQRDGALVQDIYPTERHSERVSSGFGSRYPFAFHSDQAYNPNTSMVPNVVLLSCVRNKERATTLVANVHRIVGALSSSDIEILSQSVFRFHYGRQEEEFGSRVGPVLTGSYTARLGADMSTDSPDHDQALENLIRVAGIVSERVTLNPGEVLVTPNQYYIHARTEFPLLEDSGSRRWLQRVDVW